MVFLDGRNGDRRDRSDDKSVVLVEQVLDLVGMVVDETGDDGADDGCCRQLQVTCRADAVEHLLQVFVDVDGRNLALLLLVVACQVEEEVPRLVGIQNLTDGVYLLVVRLARLTALPSPTLLLSAGGSGSTLCTTANLLSLRRTGFFARSALPCSILYWPTSYFWRVK